MNSTAGKGRRLKNSKGAIVLRLFAKPRDDCFEHSRHYAPEDYKAKCISELGLECQDVLLGRQG